MEASTNALFGELATSDALLYAETTSVTRSDYLGRGDELTLSVSWVATKLVALSLGTHPGFPSRMLGSW